MRTRSKLKRTRMIRAVASELILFKAALVLASSVAIRSLGRDEHEQFVLVGLNAFGPR
jgi:hypothetical protein